MKIKCPSGAEHSIEDTKACPHCHTNFPKPVLHALLLGRDREPKTRQKPAFGIGNLVSNCLRHSYYKYTEEQIVELEKLWIFSRGHAIHSFVTTTLDKKEKEIYIKKEFPKFDIHGFIDAVHDGVIYEFKTTSNIPDAPQTSHTLQAQAYYSMLPEEQKEKIKEIKIVYLSLNKIRTFSVPKRDIMPFLEARANQLLAALQNEIPPEKELGWLCKCCEFYSKCFDRKVNFID